jgi:hypothetical protein
LLVRNHKKKDAAGSSNATAASWVIGPGFVSGSF